MKRIIAAAALTIFTAGIAMAAAPETITLPAKMGDVTFHHAKHQETLKDCKKCHATDAGGKIEGLGKDWAHKTCKGCHTELAKGPTKCGDCHVKKS
jgi:hypothetical protein